MKIIFFLMLLAGYESLFGQTSSYLIRGNAEALNNQYIYLYYKIDGADLLDSARVVDGKFEFKGEAGAPVQGYIYLNVDSISKQSGTYIRDLYIEKGEVTVEVSASNMKNAVISGTPTNEENNLFMAINKPISDRYVMLMKRRKEASEADQESAVFNHEMDSLIDACTQESMHARIGFIKEHPHSLVSLIQLDGLSFFKISESDMSSMFNSLDPDLRKSQVGQKIETKIIAMRQLNAGVMAPDFAMPDADGREIRLSSFRGKYVLVDFWASWCVPCRQENPNLVRLYAEYKDKGFTVLSISLDSKNSRSAWLKAVEDDNLTWTQLSELKGFDSEAAILYHVKTIPASFLIGPDGRIIDQNLKGLDLINKLKELLH